PRRRTRDDGARDVPDGAEGPQGAADDVQTGNPDDQEPPARAAAHRDHEDRGGLPRRDWPRGHRDGAVPLHAVLRAARRVRLDAPDPNPDRRLHRMPIAARLAPGDLPEVWRAPDVWVTARRAVGRRAPCRLSSSGTEGRPCAA